MMHKEVIGDCELWLADCLDVLPTLGKVDAVVTDPPYGIGFKYWVAALNLQKLRDRQQRGKLKSEGDNR